jgi:hypothetical protein
MVGVDDRPARDRGDISRPACAWHSAAQNLPEHRVRNVDD